jgi:anti-sigma regulatory factor (Ser/Thr protein kinase)
MSPDPASPPTAARQLASFEVASVPGNEREVLARVARSVAGQLPPDRVDRLKTAVAEATLNAIEHGHGGRPDLPVAIEVVRQGDELVVTITDQGPARRGGHGGRPQPAPEEPDLTRKLAGQQSPRGWGLFLIRHMVDAMDEVTRDGRHMVRLVMRAGGD